MKLIFKISIISLLAVFSLACPQDASAKIFYSKQGALKAAFPEATRVERVNLFLSSNELVEVRKLAKSSVEQRVMRTYAGYRGDTLLGHAFIDTHDVRSLSETLMVVISPDGMVRNTMVLAFHEPPDYLPSKQWLAQIAGKGLHLGFQVNREVDCITGATMTSYAVVDSVRRVLAVHQLVVQPKIRSSAQRSVGVTDSM
jgi:Na+-translocating ferredoxin:NAD+ oxidoreductase RnfG subunit